MSAPLRHALFFVGAITAARAAALFFSAAELGPDESQYWVWAQAPAFGYFSKPPLIAWVIAATTALCGDGEACVRLGAPILHGLTALVIFFAARALYDARIALLAAIAYATLPGVSLSAEIISTDVPLLFFWALALLALAKGLLRPAAGWALLLGAALGLGLLAKYAMGYFVLSALIGAMCLPRLRALVFSRFGALALVVALALFAPNVLWNVRHGLATVRHTAANADLGAELFNPGALAEFLAAQAGVFGPILFAVLLVGAARALWPGGGAEKPAAREADVLLIALALPTLAIASTIAFLTRAHGNWAAPAYVAATPLVLNWLVAERRKLLLRLSFGLHVAVAVLFPVAMAEPALIDALGLANAAKRLRGWDALGQAIAARVADGGYTSILAVDRELSGALHYYVRPRSIPVVAWDFQRPPNNHYELAMRINAATGKRVLFVNIAQGPAEVLSRFETVTALGAIEIPLDAKRVRTTYLYALDGFKPAP
jgi:4-amino-4-deoxy-L-arabinose transferase-like glycosyltransferase